MHASLRARRWTVEEYERMVAAGVLTEDDQVELVEGAIVERAPIGARHAACVKALANVLRREVGDRHVVSVQDPIRLGTDSEPQPDLALLAWREDFYYDALPVAADVVVVIEVADSTAASDAERKLPLYARAGIAEAWLVDLAAGAVEVHTRPSATGYGEHEVLRPGETIRSSAAAGLSVTVREALVREAGGASG